jgi:hypothetical protein
VTVTVPVSELGIGAEVIAVFIALFRTVVDAGTAVESVGSVTVQLQLTDGAAAVEAIFLAVALQVLQQATGVDVALGFPSPRIARVALSLRRRRMEFGLARRRSEFRLQGRSLGFAMEHRRAAFALDRRSVEFALSTARTSGSASSH